MKKRAGELVSCWLLSLFIFAAPAFGWVQTVAWSPNPEPDLDHYEVIQATIVPDQNKTGPWAVIGIVPAGTTTFTATGLADGAEYMWQAFAVDAVGNRCDLPSNAAWPERDKTPPAPVDSVTCPAVN